MLPPGEAKKVLDWAQQLADLGHGQAALWSDSWSKPGDVAVGAFPGERVPARTQTHAGITW